MVVAAQLRTSLIQPSTAMESQSSTPIPPRLEPVLRKLRGRIRSVIATRGALITAVAALGGLLALVAIDFMFAPLPGFVRWMCPFIWAVGVIVVAYLWWWLPLRKPLELVRVARWLETHHPELDERISTVLEVSKHGGSGMSGQLIGQIAKEAAASLDDINPKVEVSTRRARRWLWPAAALLVIWSALFALWPDPTARHVVRALVPTSNLGNAAGRITVTPGSIELIEGDPLQITARHSAGPATRLELVLHLTDGTSTTLPMEPAHDGSIHHIGRADRTFEYEVRSGRQTSDRFKVTVWPAPRFTDPRVKLEFPAYTGWAPREQALGDGVSAINGTKVELRSKLNTPIESARLEIDGETAGATQLERAADGGNYTSRWTLEAVGHSMGRVVLKHRLGREFEAAAFTIESLADTPPEVKWLSAMQKETRLRPDDLLEMGYEVTDDVGLGSVKLEIQPQRGENAYLTTETPPRIGRGEPPTWRGRIRQPVGELVSRWPDSRVFKLRMRAEDSRPAEFAGPGIGTSEWVVIRIDDGAQSLARQEVDAAHSDARETIEEARQMVQQAREKLDRHRHELQKEDMPEWAQKELGKAREQLAEAREKLEELADRMEESVHAAKAPDVREAAETVEQARQQMEDAPLQDTPKQRDETAAMARENAEKAQRQLEKLLDDIQRSEPQLQDYAQLKELEQQQRELARQAAQEEPSGEWQQQQEHVAEALRQEVQQQPQAQAAALEEQARKARELAAEAREQAAGQEALQQIAPNPAAQAAELQDQLAKEQAEIASEANEQLAEARERQDNATANTLPEAVESAVQAAGDLAEKKADAATENAQQAAEQLADAAKTAEAQTAEAAPSDQTGQAQAAADLAALAERQQDLAEALSDFASGKTAEAAAKLAEMRAGEVQELAEEIRETPQVNGTSGHMQQAAQSSEQAAGKANEATQAGEQGKPAEASASHAQSSGQLQQTAAQLDQAAAEFSQQAAEAAGRNPGDNQAPVPAQPLADAFQAASQAADANQQAQAASQAQAAADALAQAADGTLRAMQGQAPRQGPPGQPGQPQAGPPGTNPTEALRSRGPDPGVPPELAKLGISAEDWEKIKASLKSETGGSSAIALPEEYRELVRSYFEQMSKGDNR
jgi:hypothetical protein